MPIEDESSSSLVSALMAEIEAGADVSAELWTRLASDPEALRGLLQACDRDSALLGEILGYLGLADLLGPEFESFEALNELANRAEAQVSAAALEWLRVAIEDYENFEASLPHGNSFPLSLHMTRRLKRSVPVWIRLMFKAPSTPTPILWASCVLDGVSPAALAIATAGEVNDVSLDDETKPVFVPGPLFRYHPERFRQTRRYARSLRSTHPAGGLLTYRSMQVFTDAICAEMNARVGEVDRRGKEISPARVLDDELAVATSWVNFTTTGKQIFEIPPGLCDMLRRTDADDIPVDLIRLPYPVLYLRFGPIPGWSLKPGWIIDGAYLEHYPEQRLLITRFTAFPEVADDVAQWHGKGEPFLSITFTKDHIGLGLGTAIDTVIADTLNQLQTERVQSLQHQLEIDQLAQQTSVLDGTTIKVVTDERAEEEQAHWREWQKVAHEAMHLVANALCYLTAYPDDVLPVWPHGTPQALLSSASTGTPRRRAKARSQLESMGFTKVHIFGSRMAASLKAAPTTEAEERHPRAHWRRGHWRRQAHGENRQLRRLIWLMPTLVNASNPSEDPHGHIYLVDQRTADDHTCTAG